MRIYTGMAANVHASYCVGQFAAETEADVKEEAEKRMMTRACAKRGEFRYWTTNYEDSTEVSPLQKTNRRN
jgi:hypothetical protein